MAVNKSCPPPRGEGKGGQEEWRPKEWRGGLEAREDLDIPCSGSRPESRETGWASHTELRRPSRHLLHLTEIRAELTVSLLLVIFVPLQLQSQLLRPPHQVRYCLLAQVVPLLGVPFVRLGHAMEMLSPRQTQ